MPPPPTHGGMPDPASVAAAAAAADGFATRAFRRIRPGFERIAPGPHPLRHAHLAPYAAIVLAGGYRQAGYFGRVELEAGDILVHPVLDRHENHPLGGAGVHLLRLPWGETADFGGIFRSSQVDLAIRLAARDPCEAAALLAEDLAGRGPEPAPERDWPDLLARDLREGRAPSLTAWAQAQGLRRETVARGFRRAYGAAPRAVAAELKARRAWLRVLADATPLAFVAADLGFADQPHMTHAIHALTGAPPSVWRRHRDRAGRAPDGPDARSK